MLKGGRIVYPSEYYKATGGSCSGPRKRRLSKRNSKNKKKLSKRKQNSSKKRRQSNRKQTVKRRNRK